MKDFFLGFWTDETKFVGLMRGAAVGVAGGIATGAIPMPGGTTGAWLQYVLPWVLGGGAAMATAGQKNVPQHFEVK